MRRENGRNSAPLYENGKRVFDKTAAALGIAVTLPIWAVAIVGIELSDPGPVFYKAHRVGEGNKEFEMYKFRSMRVDKSADEKGFKADRNRIFAFGEFMRSTKIDELPQLLNILRGEMSIVGPRPASVDQVEMVRSGRNCVVSGVKPGLTGPSALYDYIYGDQVEDEEEYREKVLPSRLALDVYYVDRRDMLYDLKMIKDTVLCILCTLTNVFPEELFNELVEVA
mgnify:CR=1 FL=1